MIRKVVAPQRSQAWATIAWSLAMIIAFLLTGCEKPKPHQDVCPTGGCAVPGSNGEPRYVPQCQDVEGRGPCVGLMDSAGWIYVRHNATWPRGVAVSLCPSEDGGPNLPCVWLPSVQGNFSGDSGALVYGVK